MKSETKNYREMIEEALGENGESWDDVESATLGHPCLGKIKWDGKVAVFSRSKVKDAFDYEIRDGYASGEGHNFFLWTGHHVYFKFDYDGEVGIRSVPRNPSEAMPYCITGGI